MRMLAVSTSVREYLFERRSAVRPGCTLVPTMGALHAGHAALIRRGAVIARERALAGGCVVTIFVNPTQFNDPADYTRYPRTLEADLEVCRRAGAHTVLAPTADDVYPPDAPPPVPVLPSQATDPGLEDAARPGHFAGVCQVVARLFDMVRPDAAIFGEKDWQQLRVIDAMTRRDAPQLQIIGLPTIREPDGLAMSSRNVFLSPSQRAAAATISRALAEAGSFPEAAAAEAAMRATLESAGIAVEYAVVRDAETLLAPRRGAPCRALVAGRIGAVRLLDNSPWPGEPGPAA